MHHSSCVCSFSENAPRISIVSSHRAVLLQFDNALHVPQSPELRRSYACSLYQENVVSLNVCSPLSFVFADVSCTASQCSSELRCM